MRKRSELLFNLLLIPLDSMTLLASWVVAFLIRIESNKPTVFLVPGRAYLATMIALAPISVAIFALAGLYNFDSTRSRWLEYTRVLIATSATTMFLIIVDFFTTKPLFPSKAVVIYGYAIASLSIILMRFFLNSFQRWLFRFNIGRRQVLVLGSGAVADELTYSLQRNQGYRVTSTLPIVAGSNSRIETMLEKRQIDEMIVAEPDLSISRQAELIRLALAHHVAYKYIPTVAGLYQTRSQTALLSDFPVIEVVRTPLDGWWRIYKTVFDYLAALVGLITLMPLFLVLAGLIWLNDRGSILYKHRRVGRNGKSIEVWKFRSMYLKYSSGSNKSDESVLRQLGGEALVKQFQKDQKLKDDPRVTPIGRWLRRTSLDELPQIINVLRGELSIIGPRPVTTGELKRYGESASTFLLIKPGITGLWQVSGRNDVSYDERIKLDLYYVEKWSAWLDVRIILRTIRVVLFGKGY